MECGDVVEVVVYGGKRVTARVWGVAGAGVLICSEEEYREALKSGSEPPYAGFPQEDVTLLRKSDDLGFVGK
jgi:hypothetical protein